MRIVGRKSSAVLGLIVLSISGSHDSVQRRSVNNRLAGFSSVNQGNKALTLSASVLVGLNLSGEPRYTTIDGLTGTPTNQ
jgi:DNA repair exonuclease SbcCD nuclease subunit